MTAAMAVPAVDDSFLEGNPITGTESNEASMDFAAHDDDVVMRLGNDMMTVSPKRLS